MINKIYLMLVMLLFLFACEADVEIAPISCSDDHHHYSLDHSHNNKELHDTWLKQSLDKNKHLGGFYFTQLEVGEPGQKIFALMDTGSSNFLLMPKSCSTCNSLWLDNMGSYDVGSNKAVGQPFSVFYGSGYITASIYQDKVSLTCMNSKKGTVPTYFGVIDNDKNVPNVIGLAYQSLAKGVDPATNETLTPFFDHLLQQKVFNKNVFSMQLCQAGSKNSYIKLGYDASDKALQSSSVLWTPIVNTGYYTVNAADFSMCSDGDCTKVSDKVSNPIVDSGTSIIRLHGDKAEKIANYLRSKHNLAIDLNNHKKKYNLTKEQMNNLPKLKISFIKNGSKAKNCSNSTDCFTVEVSASEYFLTDFSDSNSYKFGIYSCKDNYCQEILGDVFMKNKLIVFDRQNSRLGIMKSTCDSK